MRGVEDECRLDATGIARSGQDDRADVLVGAASVIDERERSTENAVPVCFAHMVTFTRAVPILVYEPEAVTTLLPGMAGTVK